MSLNRATERIQRVEAKEKDRDAVTKLAEKFQGVETKLVSEPAQLWELVCDEKTYLDLDLGPPVQCWPSGSEHFPVASVSCSCFHILLIIFAKLQIFLKSTSPCCLWFASFLSCHQLVSTLAQPLHVVLLVVLVCAQPA